MSTHTCSPDTNFQKKYFFPCILCRIDILRFTCKKCVNHMFKTVQHSAPPPPSLATTLRKLLCNRTPEWPLFISLHQANVHKPNTADLPIPNDPCIHTGSSPTLQRRGNSTNSSLGWPVLYHRSIIAVTLARSHPSSSSGINSS